MPYSVKARPRKRQLPIVIKSPDSRRSWFRTACARCGLPAAGINARTIGGAIRRATVECEGVGVAKSGIPFLTRCATPLTAERFNNVMNSASK